MNSGLFIDSRSRSAFRNRLLKWYDASRRDLPWRRTSDPYRVWVSEIMLQQTRVGAVLDHYRRFLNQFPTVEKLARAREQSVLAVWSGLGYYRRARHLHAAAKKVVFELEGNFPTTAQTLRELPGIGRYTGAAIASIAFQEPAAVVDGNVERVLGRVTGRGLSERETWTLAEALISSKRPGDFNQGMMELGAIVCLPKEPRCGQCPVARFCVTKGTNGSRAKQTRQLRQVSCALVQRNGQIWLVQRPRTASLMPGMWELPLIAPNGDAPAARFRHSILETDFEVDVFTASEAGGEVGKWISRSRLPKVALTGLARKILRHFKLL